MTTRRDIAANVRAEAARRQVTQRALADKLHIDTSSMAKRFNGQRDFTASEIVSIAKLFQVCPGVLLGGRHE